MFRKCSTIMLVAALVSVLGGTSVSANTPSDREGKEGTTTSAPASRPSVATGAQPDSKLKTEMRNLIAEARSGKMATAMPRQQQPAQSNSLSKGKKIAIVAVIATAVIVTVLYVHTRNHLFDNFNF